MGLLSGPDPSEPFTAARLVPTGECGPSMAPHVPAPPAWLARLALPCPAQAVGEAVLGESGWEVLATGAGPAQHAPSPDTLAPDPHLLTPSSFPAPPGLAHSVSSSPFPFLPYAGALFHFHPS